ncbi:hypothetical protein FH972_020063 [Carpinus fangiana]|uniref:RNA polymerase Rpb1 domain-containing protein n=1 Tax=Carpinus fangiana TaxID=176857 RepID=A0A5N6RV94_9ROSI|nr:hypothetical protein FH972_020063 [Carpinus fangiana]
MADISEKINLQLDDGLTDIFNDDNPQKLILHIRMVNDESQRGELPDEGDIISLKKIDVNMLKKKDFQGVPNINKVFITPGKRRKCDENEGFKAE